MSVFVITNSSNGALYDDIYFTDRESAKKYIDEVIMEGSRQYYDSYVKDLAEYNKEVKAKTKQYNEELKVLQAKGFKTLVPPKLDDPRRTLSFEEWLDAYECGNYIVEELSTV